MSYDDSLAVKFRGGIVNVYNPSGELAQTLPTGRETDACALIAPTVVAITDHGVSRFRSGSLDRLLSAPPQPLLWPTTSVLLNNNRVGIIEMGEAMLNIVDMSSGSWQRFQLLAPEIQGVRHPVRTAKEVIPEIFAAAADLALGDIYVATGPFYVKIGASILRVTDEGVLKERLRCTLPTSPNFITSHNPEGQFLVTYMAIANGVLILVSESQWHCFYYKLP